MGREEAEAEVAVNSSKENLDKDEKDVDTCADEAEESSLLESVLRASTLATSAPPNWSDSNISPVSNRVMKVLNAGVWESIMLRVWSLTAIRRAQMGREILPGPHLRI